MNLDDIRFLQRLGRRIRARRLELGLTQQELADSSGLHRTFIGFVERGERNLAILNLRLIATALRTPIEDLLASGLSRRTRG